PIKFLIFCFRGKGRYRNNLVTGGQSWALPIPFRQSRTHRTRLATCDRECLKALDDPGDEHPDLGRHLPLLGEHDRYRHRRRTIRSEERRVGKEITKQLVQGYLKIYNNYFKAPW